MLRWNGSGWRQVKAPAGAGPLSSAAIAPGGVVAVGQDTAQEQDIAVQWNHGAVRLQTLPGPAEGSAVRPVGVDVSARAATVVGSATTPQALLPAPLLLTGRL
ncbi:hypothetical protein [Streptomyces sp. CA-106131]|uniref:hypothetical protein n=1 Tax=Streptomyces sp. CA-106131 TaxID=3240045 RepID=UPI003D9420A3